jgi:hypothetical protein
MNMSLYPIFNAIQENNLDLFHFHYLSSKFVSSLQENGYKVEYAIIYVHLLKAPLIA